MHPQNIYIINCYLIIKIVQGIIALYCLIKIYSLCYTHSYNLHHSKLQYFNVSLSFEKRSKLPGID